MRVSLDASTLAALLLIAFVAGAAFEALLRLWERS